MPKHYLYTFSVFHCLKTSVIHSILIQQENNHVCIEVGINNVFSLLMILTFVIKNVDVISPLSQRGNYYDYVQGYRVIQSYCVYCYLLVCHISNTFIHSVNLYFCGWSSTCSLQETNVFHYHLRCVCCC